MSRQRRVLVVDDEESIRLLMSNVFRAGGYAVECVGTGREALAMLDSLPDLVTVDLTMPDIPGWVLIEKILALPKPPVVVIVSGRTDIGSHPLLPRVAGVVHKPFGPHHLLEICEAALADRKTKKKAAAPAVERRRVPRREIVMDVRVAAAVGNPLFTGRVVDLSPLGAEIELPTAMDAGSQLRVALRFPGRTQPVLVDGRIQYCAPRDVGAWACGLAFSEVSEDLRQQLQSLLDLPTPAPAFR